MKKTTYDYINCSEKSFNEIEFQTLRNEMNTRLDIAYGHGFTLAAVILVFWAAIFTFSKDLYDLAAASDSIIGKSAFVDGLVVCAVVLFCGIPTLLIYPFSIKYRDNIRQIISIATYIRVFFEYPSFIKRKEKGKDSPKVFGWELLHCNHNIPHGNHLAIEYFIISVASIILATVFGAALVACIIGNFKNPEHVYVEGSFAVPIIIISGIIAIAYLIFLGVVACRCKKNVKIEDMFAGYGSAYFELYVKQAVELNIFDQQAANELIEYMKDMGERDAALNEILRKKIR